MITSQKTSAEITFKVIFISIILTFLLSISGTYMAMRVGILTSSSIPAAMLALCLLKPFKQVTLLENNLIQTAASAGQAIAGGIVYTLPALIIIHYWTNFDYITTMLLALSSAFLGILFSIPLRHLLMTDPELSFPEGNAIAKLLATGENKIHYKDMLVGGGVGALLELFQSGFQIVSSQIHLWFNWASYHVYTGFSFGFAPALIGAGYLAGFRFGISLILGAVLGWGLGVPIASALHDYRTDSTLSSSEVVRNCWSETLIYVGLGALLGACIYTVASLIKPIYLNLKKSISSLWIFPYSRVTAGQLKQNDLPMLYIIIGVITNLAILFFLLQNFTYYNPLVDSSLNLTLILLSLMFILVVGFIFSIISSYFSGLVGVSASPGSAIVLSGSVISGLLIYTLIVLYPNETQQQSLYAQGFVIIIGAVITGISAVANDNMQDLKVGYIVGSTPWKQQVMLMLGAVIASLIVPAVMSLLFDTYGIGDVLPHLDMDKNKTLSVPAASMMAIVVKAIFNRNFPMGALLSGIVLIILVILYRKLAKHFIKFDISIIGIGMGIYLPLATSTPIVFGALFSLLNSKKSHSNQLIACGLITGAALTDVVMAIPAAITKNQAILKIMPSSLMPFTPWLGIAALGGLAALFWQYRKD